MLTIGDVAQCLGVHPHIVRGWSKKSIPKSYRIGPRRDRRFRREDIDDFIGLEQSEKLTLKLFPVTPLITTEFDLTFMEGVLFRRADV